MKKRINKKVVIFLLLVVVLGVGNVFASSPYTYTPYLGKSNLYESSGKRYSKQEMYWRVGGMSEFNSNYDALEVQTVFYNYDGKAWSKDAASSYQSNLPNSYLDTQAFDGSDEINYAVGTFYPIKLTAETWYYATITLSSTSSTGSRYKIEFQDSYKAGGVNSKWSVFSESLSRVIPFHTNFYSPGYMTFKYEWENNGTMNAAADALNLGQWGAGTMSSSSDVDYWDFNVGSGRTVKLWLEIPPQLSSVDYELKLYNNSGTLIASSTKGAGQDESISTWLAAGHYYIKVYSYSGSNSQINYQVIPY